MFFLRVLKLLSQLRYFKSNKNVLIPLFKLLKLLIYIRDLFHFALSKQLAHPYPILRWYDTTSAENLFRVGYLKYVLHSAYTECRNLTITGFNNLTSLKIIYLTLHKITQTFKFASFNYLSEFQLFFNQTKFQNTLFAHMEDSCVKDYLRFL